MLLVVFVHLQTVVPHVVGLCVLPPVTVPGETVVSPVEVVVSDIPTKIKHYKMDVITIHLFILAFLS